MRSLLLRRGEGSLGRRRGRRKEQEGVGTFLWRPAGGLVMMAGKTWGENEADEYEGKDDDELEKEKEKKQNEKEGDKFPR